MLHQLADARLDDVAGHAGRSDVALEEKTDGALSEMAIAGAHDVFAPVVKCFVVDGTVGEESAVAQPKAFVEIRDEICGADGIEDNAALTAASTVYAESGYHMETAK